MKAVILAGGYGTRISEESHLRPKPMIEIGGMPILWHIMKHYSAQGINDFVICAGYKQHVIKEWFADYFLHTSDITFDYAGGELTTIVHNTHAEPWRVTVVDTGLDTQTGGRILRVREHVGDAPFMLTYGDGVSDVNLGALLQCHHAQGRIATITAVRLSQSKGVLDLAEDSTVHSFREKSDSDESRINGGFMVLEPDIFSYLDDDSTIFERGPMERLATEGQLTAYRHDGFWQCMDTRREMELLEAMWRSGDAPWRTW